MATLGKPAANRNAMKQTSNKNIGGRVDVLRWSEEMDLLAIGTEKGEVILQRLKWQKVWQLLPPEEGLKVRGIAWRPGENLIAIGYSNGTILQLDIETKDVVHSFSVQSDISCMNWTDNGESDETANHTWNSIHQNHATFLPTLPVLSTLCSSTKPASYNPMDFCRKHILNVLLVGTVTGQLHLSALGMLPAGRVDVLAMAGLPPSTNARIHEAQMSFNFKQLVVALEQDTGLTVIVLENNLLHKYAGSLLNLSINYAQILSTMTYINDTIDCIVETWETVLLEMDKKLTQYADDHPGDSISADFLELLMFGTTSPGLEEFLLRDLSEKGLRRLGNSMDLCYATIQRLVVVPLYNAIYALFYHLNVLEGMLQNRVYYGALMIRTASQALRDCGAFQIKCFELQQTIDYSKRDFKIFFRWLCSVIVRLMDEPLQEHYPTITQQELTYLANFLAQFDDSYNSADTTVTEDSQRKLIGLRRKFNLERVGQYLEDKPLLHKADGSELSQWKQMLKENECFQNSPNVFPHREDHSLLQEQKRVKESIRLLFEQPSAALGGAFRPKNLLTLQQQTAPTANEAIRSFASCNHPVDNVTLVSIIQSSNSLLLVECYAEGGMKMVRLRFEDKPYFDQPIGTLSFRHAQFYNADTLSLLLHTQPEGQAVAGGSYYLQLALGPIREILRSTELREGARTLTEETDGCRVLNAYTFIDECALKLLDGNDGHRIAVSGKRNVTAILSESRRNIRLYDMDAQDEEEEEEDDDRLENSSQLNSSLDNSQESIHQPQ
ncbi:anaphase-promoting complex subunit 4 [Anopheles darlingi]|uniref:anaphase-promoting complex subunit 4 n=1 Tax=Anopheles darlingi TaxID=43151 RepID=UPI0021001C0F|nr:anaphase-promoting complex subunit 4 [Anopheles darlingi]